MALVEARENQGWTLEEAASHSNVSRNTVWNAEQGCSVSRKTRAKLAKAYGKNESDLWPENIAV